MKLNPKAWSLSLGIVWGLVIFLLTNISLLRGGAGEHLGRLSVVYIGYSFSFVGSLVGFVWGFVSMFIIGWVLASLYNKFAGGSS
jgi:hypothetical protein